MIFLLLYRQKTADAKLYIELVSDKGDIMVREFLFQRKQGIAGIKGNIKFYRHGNRTKSETEYLV